MDIHIPDDYGVDQEELEKINKKLKSMKKYMEFINYSLISSFDSGIGVTHTLQVNVKMCDDETTLYFNVTDYTIW